MVLKRFKIESLFAISVMSATLALSIPCAFAQGTAVASPSAPATSTPPTAAEIEAAKAKSDANPADAKLRFEYGEMLRKSGDLAQASVQYLHATELDASYYIAYHYLAQTCTDKTMLEEGVQRLTHLMDQKPTDLMLRVALSELLETQGKYFEASRPLIKLVFTNTVPAKYVDQLNKKIRFLQAKAHAQHVATKAQESSTSRMEKTALPLPDESLRQGLDEARLEQGASSHGFGHSRLQH